VIASYPWILSPAAAVFLLTLLVNVAVGDVALQPPPLARVSSHGSR
jgi:hypothetical protein